MIGRQIMGVYHHQTCILLNFLDGWYILAEVFSIRLLVQWDVGHLDVKVNCPVHHEVGEALGEAHPVSEVEEWDGDVRRREVHPPVLQKVVAQGHGVEEDEGSLVFVYQAEKGLTKEHVGHYEVVLLIQHGLKVRMRIDFIHRSHVRLHVQKYKVPTCV